MEFIRNINATPSKRIYWAVIADYDLKLSICELIDNAIDNWHRMGEQVDLVVKIDFDDRQKNIRVQDNAGGIKESDLKVIISPGDAKSTSDEETIGIFGVGSKRAAVALSQDIKITSRYENENTFMVCYDDAWLEKADDWDVPVFKVNNINAGSTIIELQKLRHDFYKKDFALLQSQLSYIYAKILHNRKIAIRINGRPLNPKNYEHWSFPPSHEPTVYKGGVLMENERVDYEILCGLTKSLKEQVADEYEEYGVYFYCNDRLIERAVKTFDVGFGKSMAGKLHTSHQIVRVIVSLKGKSKLMPWNSSKSKININHPIFKKIQTDIVEATTRYSKISKSFSNNKDSFVFKYKEGEIKEVRVEDKKVLKSYLPPLPKIQKTRYDEVVRENNKDIAKDKPWTVGLYEVIIAVNVISKLNLKQKNRIILLLLDSTLEIAFKDYLANEVGGYSDERLNKIFKNRHDVHNEVKNNPNCFFSAEQWKRIEYFYKLRCDLVHKKSSANISDDDVENFKTLVEEVLKKLFDISL
jgi:hypothetical protein